MKKQTKGVTAQIDRIKWMRKKSNKIIKNLDDKNIYEKAIELYTNDNYTLFKYQSHDELLLNKECDSDQASDYENSVTEYPKLSKNDFDEFKSAGLKF